jgi:hypothetical protein
MDAKMVTPPSAKLGETVFYRYELGGLVFDKPAIVTAVHRDPESGARTYDVMVLDPPIGAQVVIKRGIPIGERAVGNLHMQPEGT